MSITRGRGAGGDEHDVGGAAPRCAVGELGDARSSARPSRPVPRRTVHPDLLEAALDVGALRGREVEDAVVDGRAGLRDGVGDLVAVVVLQAHPELATATSKSDM